MAACLGVARVIDLFEGVSEAAQGLAAQRAAGSAGGLGNPLAVLFGEEAGGAEEELGVFLKRANPELFGTLEVLVEVGAVALEAFGEAKRGPVGDFVERALVDGGVVETFGEQRTVAVFFLPGVCKSAQGEAEALAGEVGAAGTFRNDEAAELHDELEAVSASHRIPTDPSVTVFEMLGGSSPAEDGDK